MLPTVAMGTIAGSFIDSIWNSKDSILTGNKYPLEVFEFSLESTFTCLIPTNPFGR